MNGNKLFFIDIETNSDSLEFNLNKQEIIQIGIYNLSTKEKFQEFIKCESSLSEFIKRLTGITNEEIELADNLELVLKKALDFIGSSHNSILVGHNISGFDIPILSKYNKKFSEYKYIDTLELFLLIFPGLKAYSVQDLYKFFIKKEYNETHQALQDSMDEERLFSSIINLDYIEKYYYNHNKDIKFIKEILRQRSSNNLLIDNKNYIKDFVKSLFSTINIDGYTSNKQKLVEKYFAIQFEKEKISDEIIDKEELSEITKISTEDMDKSYENIINGIGKEPRDTQRAIIQNIKDVFNQEQKNLFIEAGTGIGKTFGYLLPAMQFIDKNPKKKIFLATYSKVLQEQLRSKDIPSIKSFYPNIKTELLKANSEAISLQNLVFKSKYFNLQNAMLRNWLYRENFYISDIHFSLIKNIGEEEKERLIYNNVVNSSYYLDHKYGFKGKFLKQLDTGQIFVVNHAFMISNLTPFYKDRFTGLNLIKAKSIISPDKYFIIDEGHNLEGVIRDRFSIDFTKKNIDNIMNNFNRNNSYNIISVIKNIVKYDNEEDAVSILSNDDKIIIDDLLNFLDKTLLSKDLQLLFEKYESFLNTFNKTPFYNIIMNDIQQLRNKGYDTNSVEYGRDTFDEHYSNPALKDFFESSYDFFDKILSIVKEKIDNYVEKEKRTKIKEIFLNFLGYFNIGKTALTNNISDHFFNFIVEFKDNSTNIKNIGFVLIPNNLYKGSSFLNESLGNTVLSATLFDNNKKNSYVLEEIFNKEYNKAKILHYNSPFNYQKQRKILVTKEGSDRNYIINKFIEKYNGKTLILTTTTADKLRIANYLKDHYEKNGIMILAHETGTMNSKRNQENVASLRNNPNTILIGSKSYMEGVDVPGENLSLVIITKLPFLPPRPFIEFKDKQYKNKGYKFVYKFLSSLNFRQAIGRLIRSKTDFGEILILDNRFNSSSGSFFRDYLEGEIIIEI